MCNKVRNVSFEILNTLQLPQLAFCSALLVICVFMWTFVFVSMLSVVIFL